MNSKITRARTRKLLTHPFNFGLFNNPNFEASPKIAYQILAVQDISVVPTIKEGKKIPSDLFGLEQNKQNDNSAHALKNINY